MTNSDRLQNDGSRPVSLEEQTTEARIDSFRSYAVAHPRLVEAKERLLAAIRGSERNTLILVLGPTGVGKTTLRLGIERILIRDSLKELEADPGRMAAVGIEAVAPESGNFNWTFFFKLLLEAMEEPLAERKLELPAHDICRNQLRRRFAGPRNSASDFRYAVEQVLRCRRPAAVLIDEAQHLAKISSGRKLLDQLDVIKSIANRTGTPHVLFGTYDLLSFRNLSAQLSRRSCDIHFRRYRAEDEEDRQIFLNVLGTLARHLPLPETPDLAKDWELLYERSLGCVGVLKEWLIRALQAALSHSRNTITRRDLERHPLSASQCARMLTELKDGEAQLGDDNETHRRLLVGLGLPIQSAAAANEDSRQPVAAAKVAVPPGHRLPRRDRIGRDPAFAVDPV
jgi:energy-coupling factor transporter ATP-binding protein EcfA2